MRRRAITLEEIEAAKTTTGGFSYDQLRAWGVRCPPAAGWRKRIMRDGVPASCPFPDGFDGSSTDLVPATNPLLAHGLDPTPIEMPGDAFVIYTDGSCDPGSGIGGWGFAVFSGYAVEHEGSGGDVATTNNRMELQAAIEAVQWLGPERAALVWTDSAYVVRGYEAWRRGWRRSSWTKVPARANADLWTILEAMLSARRVDVRWTRGHAGTAGNERADVLAATGRRSVGRSASSTGRCP